MKRCPQCLRNYFDETMLYCLDDGAVLLAGPAVDQQTLVFPWPAGFSDAPTHVSRETSALRTIAVLPFVNMSGSDETEYFSDGLAEELLNVLSKIEGLRVAARTSAFAFKGKQSTVAEIGQALNVSSVVEGSIRMAGERVRISVQLVSVTDGYQLWSESYDRTMDDIFAVQDDIAGSVVEELRKHLGDRPSRAAIENVKADVERAVRGRASDPEAQRLMLLGRFFLDRTTRDDTARAIDHFRRALELDPDYAVCCAELARAHSIEAGRAWSPTDEAFERARQAALRALELEPDLAEGYAALGRIQATYDLDLKAAESSYNFALERAPGNAIIIDGAGVLAYKLGKLETALSMLRDALVHDPLSPAFWHNLGLASHAAGLLDESAEAFRHALALAPQRLVSSALLALVEFELGDTDAAASHAAAEPDEFWRTWASAIIYARTDQKTEANKALRQLLKKYSAGNTYQIAEVYAMRGEIGKAFEWLSRSTAERDPGVTHALVNPRFRPLHDDPRWRTALEAIGF